MDKRLKQIILYKERNCSCTPSVKCKFCEIIEPLIDEVIEERKKEIDEDLKSGEKE